MTRRVLSVSASTSTTPWPTTAGLSVPQQVPMASPAPWGRWTLTRSLPPPRWSRWIRSTSRQVQGCGALLELLILMGRKVWSSTAPLSPSARRKVRGKQWRNPILCISTYPEGNKRYLIAIWFPYCTKKELCSLGIMNLQEMGFLNNTVELSIE